MLTLIVFCIMKLNLYIDGNNLYRAAKDLGYKIDYKKFKGWIRQKYKLESIYLFMGFVESRINFYEYLKQSGFILIFKQTISIQGLVKGNCDAELVLKVVSDFYTDDYDMRMIVTGDGDFGCVIEFLQKNKALGGILASNRYKEDQVLHSSKK